MELDFRAFAFIITLAAVVNGLGIVRWLTGLAKYLRRKDELRVQHYRVYSLSAGFQFLFSATHNIPSDASSGHRGGHGCSAARRL